MIYKIKKGINKLLYKMGYRIEKNMKKPHIFLQEYFKNNEIVAVEIGVYEGEHSLELLKKFNIKKLYLIDPYEEYEGFDISHKKSIKEDLEKARKKAKKKLKKYKNKIIWIEKKSDNAINNIPMADFIYIDGNHGYQFVKKDMENYYKKVGDRGILAGHDIAGLKHKGVAKAYFEFCHQHGYDPLILYPDWIIIKNQKRKKCIK